MKTILTVAVLALVLSTQAMAADKVCVVKYGAANVNHPDHNYGRGLEEVMTVTDEPSLVRRFGIFELRALFGVEHVFGLTIVNLRDKYRVDPEQRLNHTDSKSVGTQTMNNKNLEWIYASCKVL